jgi:hypothetical protein
MSKLHASLNGLTPKEVALLIEAHVQTRQRILQDLKETEGLLALLGVHTIDLHEPAPVVEVDATAHGVNIRKAPINRADIPEAVVRILEIYDGDQEDKPGSLRKWKGLTSSQIWYFLHEEYEFPTPLPRRAFGTILSHMVRNVLLFSKGKKYFSLNAPFKIRAGNVRVTRAKKWKGPNPFKK